MSARTVKENASSLAMIGCGAVAELFHLPAIALDPHCRLSLLVDTDTTTTKRLARAYRGVAVADDYRAALGTVDAAIVALPHHLHEPVCVALLREGVHVLVEKPMTLSAEGCRAMRKAAEQGGAVLCVGLLRRFLPAVAWLRQVIASEALGPALSFDVREGARYDWPLRSDYLLRKDTCGGGVLLDTGAHTLDQVLYWFGPPQEVGYFDDSHGGVEAECRVELTMASGVTGTVELSRTRRARNTAIVRFRDATVEIALTQNRVGIRWSSGKHALIGAAGAREDVLDRAAAMTQQDLVAAQLAHFVGAIRGECAPLADGTESEQVLALIERCYEIRQPLRLPWEQASLGTPVRSEGI